MRCEVDDTDGWKSCSNCFSATSGREIAEFRKAVAQFQIDLPAVLQALRAMIETAQRDNAAFREAAGEIPRARAGDHQPRLTAEDDGGKC